MRVLTIGIILLLFASVGVAQGEDGGNKPNEKSIKPGPKSGPKQGSKTRTKPGPKPAAKTPPKPKDNPLAFTVAATISVNEPESEILLARNDGGTIDQDTYVTPADGSAIKLQAIRGGVYTITARKTGFYEAKKTFTVTKKGPNSFSLLLNPSTAILTVRTNVNGVSIEIEGIGEFQNEIDRRTLPPGTYTVTGRKNGYLPDSKVVSLAAVGTKQDISLTLNPISIQDYVAMASDALNKNDYAVALKNARIALSAQPENGPANRLTGEAYLKLSKPTEAAEMLGRAVANGEPVSYPIRRYNKERSSLQLLPGRLDIGVSQIRFVPESGTAMAFLISPRDTNELIEKIDEFGVRHVSLKAKGIFGSKNETRTIRLYPNRSSVKDAGKKLSCDLCNVSPCPCQSEEKAMLELLGLWRNGRLGATNPGFGVVLPPSENMKRLGSRSFSMSVPENWVDLTIDDVQVNGAGRGGFEQQANKTFNVSHGFFASIQPNLERLNLNAALDLIAKRTIEGNAYLRPGRVFAVDMPSGRYRALELTGHSPVSNRDELITVYVALRNNGDIFSVTFVSPPDEKEEYTSVFRRILHSIELR